LSKRVGALMLINLTPEISECYLRAEECRRWAEGAANPSMRDDYLAMERRWLSLARNYEFIEHLDILNVPFSH
jgi:hypothetical protein